MRLWDYWDDVTLRRSAFVKTMADKDETMRRSDWVKKEGILSFHSFKRLLSSLIPYNGILVSQSCSRKSDIEKRRATSGLNFSV